jgi:Putative polyhydroxyalkanoic acid system protein (PHA_gran_rgn)
VQRSCPYPWLPAGAFDRRKPASHIDEWDAAKGSFMSKPLVVSIPHRLGKPEAVRRLKTGLDNVRANFAHVFTITEETWTDDRLQFCIRALGQVVNGSIDVAQDHVRLEVFLPWLLAKLAESLQPLIRREGTLMLEKK